MRAELTSVFLAAEKGIPHNPEQHAAYVASWIQTLKNDKNEIFRAAKDAHQAADYLIAFDKARSIEQTTEQTARTETSEMVAARDAGGGSGLMVEKRSATETRQPDEHSLASDAATRGVGGLNHADPSQVQDSGWPAGSKSALAKESLAAAEGLTKRVRGQNAKHYLADVQSGTYRGVIVAETVQHVVQRITPKSVAIHDKSMLPSSLSPGANVVVSYSNNVANVRPHRSRQKGQALAR